MALTEVALVHNRLPIIAQAKGGAFLLGKGDQLEWDRLLVFMSRSQHFQALGNDARPHHRICRAGGNAVEMRPAEPDRRGPVDRCGSGMHISRRIRAGLASPAASARPTM